MTESGPSRPSTFPSAFALFSVAARHFSMSLGEDGDFLSLLCFRLANTPQVRYMYTCNRLCVGAWWAGGMGPKVAATFKLGSPQCQDA